MDVFPWCRRLACTKSATGEPPVATEGIWSSESRLIIPSGCGSPHERNFVHENRSHVHVLFLPVPTPREAYAQSLAGFMIWLPAMVLVQPGWSPALLAFGPLVLYPLLFEMIGEQGLRRLSLVAFLPVLGSYAFEQGNLAGALAAPWLAFAFAIAFRTASSFLRLRVRLVSQPSTYKPDAQAKGKSASEGTANSSKASSLVHLWVAIYLIIGACWLVLARLGQRPLDYEHAIVHATAVHFHYAGFVLPILALQWLNAAPSGRRYLMLGALLLGVPLVAAGITLSAFGVHWPVDRGHLLASVRRLAQFRFVMLSSARTHDGC